MNLNQISKQQLLLIFSLRIDPKLMTSVQDKSVIIRKLTEAYVH